MAETRRSFRRRAAALACALAFTLPKAQAADFDSTVFFGDSLTDSGAFGAKFTTNPGPVWSELVAARLGTAALPSVGGGTNYATGGARITLLPGVPAMPPTDTAPPVTTQISTYLAATGGVASNRTLYTVWGGANDVFVATMLGAAAPAYLAQTAGEEAAQLDRLRTAGARYVMVANLPDIGTTPFGASQGAAGAAALTQFSAGYNAALYAAIAARGLRVIPLDTFSLLHEVLANPAAYGFANASLPACGATPSLVCTQANLVAPGADQNFLFADGVHPTSAGHALLAAYAESILAAPGQISMLPETAIRSRAAFTDRLFVRLAEPQRGTNLWVTVDGQRANLDSDGISSSAHGNGAGITVGADFARSATFVVGGALGLATLKPKFGNGGDYRQDETVVSLYGGWRAGALALNGVLAYGALSYDVNRQITLGAAQRTASGSPDGRNLSLAIEASYRFAAGALAHGPLAGVLLQRARVDEFSEQGAGSASLRYEEQARSSAIGRLGWQFAFDAGRWQPYARLSLERELRDPQRDINAQLVTAPELPSFSMPAVSVDRNTFTALVGTSVRLAPRWSASVGVSQTQASRTSVSGAFATLSAAF